MRHVDFAPFGRKVPALGFGCASLGSRVDATRGSAALARAFAAGITWFDVAPSYGDGNAESILASFVAGKRSHVVVCTKVGILPSRASLPGRLAKPLAQSALRWVPALRGVAVKHRPPAQRVEITGAFIESSLENSLKRLQTDYVDVLALHEATLADLEREDVLRSLENVVARGYARSLSMAGDLDVGLRALELSQQINTLQFPNSPFAPNVARAGKRLPKHKSVGFVTHSVYGHAAALERLTTLLAQSSSKRELMTAHGYSSDPGEAAVAFLFDFALASNSHGVVLLSMYQSAHLQFALERVTISSDPDSIIELSNQLLLGPA
jgi:aryl-alcohol dehydrogenase-like predicted oxidoreductase